MGDCRNYVVYMHTVPNGRRYIGITHQKLQERWRGGMHYNYNRRFFLAIAQYGWDNIKHEILYENLSQEEAEEKEEKLIKEYRANEEEYGYNMTSGGKGAKGCKVSLETREKLSKSNKGKHHTEEAKKRISESNKGKRMGSENVCSRQILQFDLNGNLIKEWDCFMDIQRELKVSYPSIWRVCNDKQQTAHGYVWKYKDGNLANKRTYTNRNIEQITFNGKTQSLTRWAEETNISAGTLWARLNQLGWTIEKALTTEVRHRGG